MSDKQLTANRANARLSTGPKTAAGKAASRLNACKHGLLAKHVVIQRSAIRESPREFQQLHAELWDDLAPVGRLEELLVEQIVTLAWRRRRVLTAESGEIAVNVEVKHQQRSRPNRWAAQFATEAALPTGDVALKMEESTVGLRFRKELLLRVRTAVVRDGSLTDAALGETHYAGKPNTLTRQLTRLRGVADANLEQLLQEIDRLLAANDQQEEETRQREAAEESAHLAADVLPSWRTLKKLMRYDKMLQTQFDRALLHLERLQRRRQGSDEPPPLRLEVTAP